MIPTSRFRSLMRSASPQEWTVVVLTLLVVACGDSDPVTPPGPETREVGVVVSSVDVSLTVFDVEDPSTTTTIGLGPDGSPVSLAAEGSIVAVPLGVVPAVAVVDLNTTSLVRTIALPEGSGATGAAFVNDSIVLIGNSNLNTVSPVNVRSGQVGTEIPVGRFPTAIVSAGSRVFVINAELEDFTPAGPSTIAVLDRETLAHEASITLSGTNAGAGSVGPDGRMYVLNSGSFGQANGSISVVDLVTLTEVSHHEGFGDFPGSVLAASPARVFVGAFGIGTLVWNPSSGAFERGPDDPLGPGGVQGTSGVGMDSSGRVYALTPDCANPGTAVRLGASLADELSIPVGICAFNIVFTEVAGTPGG